MSRRTLLSLLVVAPLAACASPASVPPPGTYDDGPRGMTTLVESPRVAPPADDIPESKRREWIDAQRPKVVHVPQPVVERVVVREREPVRYVRTYDRRDDWYVPFWWSVGWWGGRHGHGGRNWGVGLRDRWCR